MWKYRLPAISPFPSIYSNAFFLKFVFESTLPHNPNFNNLEKEAFWKHLGNQHFLLFLQCFALFQGQITWFKPSLSCLHMFSIWTCLKICPLVKLTHYHTIPHFDALKIYSCGKYHEKKRNCCNKPFLLFSQCFLPKWHLFFILNAL